MPQQTHSWLRKHGASMLLMPVLSKTLREEVFRVNETSFWAQCTNFISAHSVFHLTLGSLFRLGVIFTLKALDAIRVDCPIIQRFQDSLRPLLCTLWLKEKTSNCSKGPQSIPRLGKQHYRKKRINPRKLNNMKTPTLSYTWQ